MQTHQILHHAHSLAAQFCHQTVNIHKIMITDVLNEMVQSDEHTCPPHAGTEEKGKGRLYCLLWCSTCTKSVFLLTELDKISGHELFSCYFSYFPVGYLQWTAMVVFSCLCARTAFTNLMNVLQDSGTPCSGQDV